MAWEQLSINRPHLVYIILGGFTSIFMLCSLFIKEKLYIGEATVATICGVIFGPHAANLINPLDWGNTDQITLEFSRIVLVVQCFAVGVELPKAYMERHWRSVVFLLLPVMTFGWLITSLFVWWMIPPLSWLESLAVAACVTATDPVLASSVVGKGKFAKRVPKHLRDLLSAESGCNDGMAFPFIYLALYLIHYHTAKEVFFHWTCFSILYECVFGAFYGFMVGYIARHAIKLAERKGIIDRESFLVFYFVLALFCAGSGSLLGMDDLLIGFAAGVGFSNDGWFTEKTEESHVSNVIDLLINLAYFVYLGTIIPWDQYNAPDHGLVPWRLVVIAILVIFFRRIPVMLLLKPFIPDIKTWREALFAGHFGPIGVGAIFVAILARAELETDSTTPLADLPGPENAEYTLIYTIWPVVTFLVISSIIVHGSSVAVFTLGKRINTLTITLSYTQDNDKSSAWMNRLPRISSQSRSMSKMSDDDNSLYEKDYPPGQLPPIGIPKLALRRQKEEDYNEKPGSRPSSLRPRRRKKKNYGGPVSQSAIMPARNTDPQLVSQESGSDTLADKSGAPSPDEQPSERQEERPHTSRSDNSDDHSRHGKDRGRSKRRGSDSPQSDDDNDAEVEAWDEGHEIIVEDEEGNVLETIDTQGKSQAEKDEAVEEVRKRLGKDHTGFFTKHKRKVHEKNEGEEMENDLGEVVSHPERSFRKAFENWKGFGKRKGHDEEKAKPERKRGPAHAYQFGSTIIVEDKDGEVIKKYSIPDEEGHQRRFTYNDKQVRQGLQRMGTWIGIGSTPHDAAADASGVSPEDLQEEDPSGAQAAEEEAGEIKQNSRQLDQTPYGEDDGLRLTVSRTDRYGLTGLQKRKHGEGKAEEEIALGNGRRLSTQEFIKQMQALDPKSKVRQVEASDASDDIVRAVKQEADHQSKTDPNVRPSARRFESTPLQQNRIEEEEGEEPSSTHKSGPSGARQRAHSDLHGSRNRPTPRRIETDDSVREIPTHDARSTIARHGQGTTAAELRRKRLSEQWDRIAEHDNEDEDQDENENENSPVDPHSKPAPSRRERSHTANTNTSHPSANDDDEPETAAERRRRLAALGVGGRDASSSDESDEDERPRQPRDHAVREPDDVSPQPERRRIQWGGERGRERGDAGDGEDDDGGAGGKQTVGRKIKNFLNK